MLGDLGSAGALIGTTAYSPMGPNWNFTTGGPLVIERNCSGLMILAWAHEFCTLLRFTCPHTRRAGLARGMLVGLRLSLIPSSRSYLSFLWQWFSSASIDGGGLDRAEDSGAVDRTRFGGSILSR